MQLIDGRPVYAATDLVGFLACSHRLALERAALMGLVHKPKRADPAIDLVAKRGDIHEQRYRDELVASGRTVIEIDKSESIIDRGLRYRTQAAETLAAMQSGADVIYQATFFDGTWLGYADFLLRSSKPSKLGSWSYEVADTKLARHVKASAVLQICSYVDQLADIQGLEPEWLYVVLGGSTHLTERLRVGDYMAYYRRVKAEFLAAVSTGDVRYPVIDPYPEPVEHCEVCNWVVECKARRRSDDDLSLVAGAGGRLREGLKQRGIAHRRELAVLDLPMEPRLDGVGAEVVRRAREQARIQVEGEDEGRIKYELLLPDRDDAGRLVADRGLLVLPPPSPNDLFFDIEGDPFALEDGVEYLFGVLEPALRDPDRPEEPYFHEIWSRDETGAVTLDAEKRAFEALVDLLIERLDRDPTLHVYHYASYEKTALGKLAQRHATREEEVDRLLRGRVLVDLFRVVRQGLRASVESYSIKRLEPLYGLVREEELRSASSSILAFEAWLEGQEDENGKLGEDILRSIAAYNRDDVVSNLQLRDWLETLRPELAGMIGEAVPRPGDYADAKQPRELKPAEQHRLDLVEALTRDVPADPAERSDEQKARWLLGQLLGFHDREEKAFWWRFFELAGMTDDELVDAREPVGRLEFVEDLGEVGRGSRLERYRFPLQDHGLKVGRGVDDPAKVSNDTKSWGCGTVESLDEVGLTVVLRRGPKVLADPRPKALIPDERVGTDAIEGSLIRIAEWVLEHGIDAPGPVRAARDLLRRHPPRFAGETGGGPLRRAGEKPVKAAVRLGLALDDSTLAIQGPPGSGKTYTAAQMILELVAHGKRVGITANSHKVIGNALDKVHEEGAKSGAAVRLGQKCNDGDDPACSEAKPFYDNGEALRAIVDREVHVLGGTAWLWSRPEFAESVDVLFVDEAGQFSLANAIAVAPAGRSVVLLGDPQQLDQPLQGSHPPGAETSALGHVLDGLAVIPEHRGLFLERTWRLHPDVVQFTSDVFYEGKLTFEPSMAVQSLHGVAPADGTGVRWLPVEHDGDATESIEEAQVITTIVHDLMEGGSTWTDHEGTVRPITLRNVVIVAPYNAHVERIARTLAAAGYKDARVGTVDKFQGQEAPISIYAMATSTPEDAPRGMEFLYSLNRLNVATSRARCAAIVIASPALVRVACRTPRQMQLANALCRFVEIAEGRDTSTGGRPSSGSGTSGPLPQPPPEVGGEASSDAAVDSHPDGAAAPTTGEQLSWLA